MTDAKDRIPVPTNGHHPPLAVEPTADAAEHPTPPAPSDTSRLGVGLNATPTQLAIGSGAVLWLLLFLFGRRRRG